MGNDFEKRWVFSCQRHIGGSLRSIHKNATFASFGTEKNLLICYFTP